MGTSSGRKCQIVLLIITILTDVADMVTDWLFFVDIWRLKPGLVYGPPTSALTNTVLATAIISSIFLLIEIFNSIKGVVSEKPFVDVDKLLLITVWFADLPEIIVSNIIAVCREDPVSIFQLSKASVVLFGMAFKLLMFFIVYCRKDKRCCISIKVRIFIFLGLFLNAAGSIAIFIFTQTNRLENGAISVTAPRSAFGPVYNNERYFKNVDIFFHHQTFNRAESGTNFVRLLSVNEIRSAGSDTKFFFNHEYENRGDKIKMTFWSKTGDGAWKPDECYTITKSTDEIKTERDCERLISSYTESVFIAFQFVAPEPFFHTLIIGDITYNMIIKRPNGDCTADTGSQVLHYYRKETQNTGYLNNNQFYNSKKMEDIKSVWKTGWFNCESSGSVAPKKDENLFTPCART